MEQISWASKHGPQDLESNLSLDFMAVDKMSCLMAEIQDPELLKLLFPLVQGYLSLNSMKINSHFRGFHRTTDDLYLILYIFCSLSLHLPEQVNMRVANQK